MIGKASFGIGPVVLSMATNQLDSYIQAKIWSLDAPDEAMQLEKAYGLASGTVRQFRFVGPRRLAFSPNMERAISVMSSDFDIVHEHGIWTAISRVVNKWRLRTGGPTVISPHGSLEPWALRRSKWRKRLALASYERHNLRNTSCLHALSQSEARDFRKFGLCGPIAVIPNGIPESWLTAKGDGLSFRRRHGISNSVFVMLFLGRITPKKGLPMLFRAMARLKRKLGKWILAVGGVEEFAHKRELISLMRQLALEPYVKFVGPLYDQDKVDAFAAADLFVLPSLSEGAPISILEALGAGIPVLTTEASPWEDLLRYRCGWWTDISEQGIADALDDVFRQPKAALNEMGERGRVLVANSYTWKRIAAQTSALYQWLLRGGSIPDFVMME